MGDRQPLRHPSEAYSSISWDCSPPDSGIQQPHRATLQEPSLQWWGYQYQQGMEGSGFALYRCRRRALSRLRSDMEEVFLYPSMLGLMLWMGIRHSSPRMLWWLKSTGNRRRRNNGRLIHGKLRMVWLCLVKEGLGFVRLGGLSRGIGSWVVGALLSLYQWGCLYE